MGRGRFWIKIYVKLLNMCSVGVLLRRNMGQIIIYLAGRSVSWEEDGSRYYIFGR